MTPTLGEQAVARKATGPGDTCVGGQNDVRVVIVAQLLEKVGGRGRFPKKLVRAARAAMGHQQAAAAQADAPSRREPAHPIAPTLGRIGEGIAVRQPSEVVVPWVGIAALAVLQPARDRLVVVAAYGMHATLDEEREHSVGARPESPEITQTEDGLRTSEPRILDRRPQRAVIRINATEHRHA